MFTLEMIGELIGRPCRQLDQHHLTYKVGTELNAISRIDATVLRQTQQRFLIA